MKKKKSWIRENAEIVISAFIIAMLIRTFIAEPFKIPTGSMEPTLHGDPRHGDRIFANKFIYRFKEPERGDVVVFTTKGIPGLDPKKKNYIKRLVAFPGETIEIKNNNIYINGRRISDKNIAKNAYENSRPVIQILSLHKNKIKIPDLFFLIGVPDTGRYYLLNKIFYPDLGEMKYGDKFDYDVLGIEYVEGYEPSDKIFIADGGQVVKIRDNSLYVDGKVIEDDKDPYNIYILIGQYGMAGEKITVPEDYYFVLGDNSGNSKDSRYWGFVPAKNLKGEAMFIWWPYKRWQIVR